MLTLLTCTGGRPEAFAILESWIRPQLGLVDRWVVVDDVEPATKVTLGQTLVRPRPFWNGEHTLGRNILAGLDAVKGDKLAFIEDDEAYLPGYLQELDGMLDVAQLAGQNEARYYNLRLNRWRRFENRHHASLCQTGIRREMFTRLRELACRGSLGLDIHLWKASGVLAPETCNVISMKGLPGRPGIGIGHRPAGSGWRSDPYRAQLVEWLGFAGAAKYATFGA